MAQGDQMPFLLVIKCGMRRSHELVSVAFLSKVIITWRAAQVQARFFPMPHTFLSISKTPRH